MAGNNFEFFIASDYEILVIIKDRTRSQQQMANITSMYENYCISKGFHAKLHIMPFLGQGHDYHNDLRWYEHELGIHPILKTKQISHCVVKKM